MLLTIQVRRIVISSRRGIRDESSVPDDDDVVVDKGSRVFNVPRIQLAAVAEERMRRSSVT